jgi:NhaA family Na+:H+ antiporter
MRHHPHAGPHRPVDRLVRPFVEFASSQSSGGIVLLAATVIALVLANSPAAEAYRHVLHIPVSVHFGSLGFDFSLQHMINDGLMALFFFQVGLEIKRELLLGELASARAAALPICAAVGGMAAPALLYLAFNLRGGSVSGWGVPMATDIAFALGVMALLGSRIPSGLKVFLAALAIVDDLGGVLVIALFYTDHMNSTGLLATAILMAPLMGGNAIGVRSPVFYAVGGVALWFAVMSSGVHPTIAGVLCAMAVPARARIDTGRFTEYAEEMLSVFREAGPSGTREPIHEEHQMALQSLEQATEAVQMPVQRFAHALHGWVGFVVMPIFALANAGIRIEPSALAGLAAPVPLGLIAGLLLGKPIGIFLASVLAVKMFGAVLPSGVQWRHIGGTAVLGGIGFTVALFIASLAFPAGTVLESAKLSILVASLAAGSLGYMLLRAAPTPSKAEA